MCTSFGEECTCQMLACQWFPFLVMTYLKLVYMYIESDCAQFVHSYYEKAHKTILHPVEEMNDFFITLAALPATGKLLYKNH